MQIKKIFLQNFRNYSKKEFQFVSGTTLIVGPNASGKTNMLEAIYLLATGRSFRAELEAEMIAYEKELARVKGEILDGGEEKNLEIVLTTGIVQNEKTGRKKCFVNGVVRRQQDFVGNLRTVYFGPDDLQLVTDSPSRRRRFLDGVLFQVDREYIRAFLSYEKGLRARNKVLEAIRDMGVPRTQLYFWDQLIIKNGNLITEKRQEFIEFINHEQLPASFGGFRIEYDISIISPQRLKQYEEEEVAAAATLVGPHRDDFGIKAGEEKRDLSSFGSRGEQRMAILWLKLCELDFIKEKTGKLPVLLLDDIFSELDMEHRKLVLGVVRQQQTIITTTDIHLVEPEFRKKMEGILLTCP